MTKIGEGVQITQPRLHPGIASLGPIMQLAFVPADVNKALKFWVETMGAGPFYAGDHVRMENVKYRGQPADIDFSMLLGYWGDMQIEFIHQHNDTPSIYSTWLKEGREGLHHVCLLVDDMAHARKVCADAGATVLQEGLVRGGTAEAIYVDTGGGPGTLVEILKPAPATLDWFAKLKNASIGWDGRDPVRR
jgi:methylmalonyl-CoA/ethylmalonyl-CoA epimerase